MDGRIKKLNRQNKNVKIIISCILFGVAAMLLVTAAWYVIRSRREIESEKVDVMVPYYLYLLNADSMSNLNFSVGNLHPGETKQEVICVSNQSPDGSANYQISRDSNFLYKLELAYTTNIPIIYKVYELEVADSTTENAIEVTTEYEDANGVMQTTKSYFVKKMSAITDEHGNTQQAAIALKPQEMEGSKKVTDARLEAVFGTTEPDVVGTVAGDYQLYDTDAGNQKLSLSAQVDTATNTVVYDRDYYLIEISWKDNVNFYDYTKETDLVNVVVKAEQPKPSVDD